MKKLLYKSWTVLLCIFCMVISNAYAAENAIKPSETEMLLLSRLGISEEDYSDAEYAEELTRAEFAVYVSGLMNLHSYETVVGDNLPFSDVNPLSAGAESIAAVNSFGAMSGSDGKFYPNESITPEQAAKTLVCITGNTHTAEERGGYPTGYLLLAGEKGILDGVDKDVQTLTRGSVLKMLYNTLFADYTEHISAGREDRYTINGTVLSNYFDIEEIKGIVTANGKTGLYGVLESAGDGRITVGNDTVECGNISADAYLGCSVKAYVKKESDGLCSLWHIEYDKNNNITEIAHDELGELSADGSCTYWNGSKKESAKLSKTASVIYNGRFAAILYNAEQEWFKLENGYVKLIDAENDGVYETVIISEAKMMIADGYDAADECIIGRFGEKSVSLKESEREEIVLTRNGKNASPVDINVWDVIEVYESTDKKLLTVTVTSSPIEGSISSTDGDKAVIGDTEYTILKFAKDNFSFKTGEKQTYYLDSKGRIAGCNTMQTSDLLKYGIMTECWLADGSDTEAWVRIYTQDGETAQYKLKSPVKTDGVSCKTNAAFVNKLKQECKKITAYKLNSDNEVIWLDTLLPNKTQSDSDLREDVAQRTAMYKKTGIFGNNSFMANTDTVIFRVPSLDSNPEDFSVVSRDSLINDKNYSTSAYTLNEFKIAAAVIIYESSDEVEGGTYMIAIDRIFEKCNDDNENVVGIRGAYLGKLTDELWCKPESEAAKLKKGDVVQANINGKNEIKSIRIMKDSSTGYVYDYAGYTSNLLGRTYGRVVRIDRSSNVMIVQVGTDDAPDERVYNISAAKYIYSYDTKSENISIGSIKDISVNSEILIRSRYMEPYECVVFN